jgi:5-methylthioadenosine/S-adenosylhomocysteine deaminase
MHLMELGLLDSSWVLGRAEHLGDADRALIRESGCHVVATPLADASCGMSSTAWTAMAQAGVPCALGTDGPVASCSVDMVEQMKALVLIQNTLRLDPTSMSVEAVLEMATLGGARALGLERDIGSLEPGKRADIAVFDMNGPHLQVAHKPTSIFVCCARGADAALVVVNGRVAWRAPGEPATPADQALVAAAR